jgi:hypothetical protein
MKKKLLFLVLIFYGYGMTTWASAQEDEIQQLLLNVEKLAQFRQILGDMKNGYEVLHTGYSTIRNLSEGNFQLHRTFLDGLLMVNPTVRNYQRVTDIVNFQIILVKEYKSAYNRYKKDGNFSLQEIEYIRRVYDRLFEKSLKNIEDLTIIISPNKLRMSDDERLRAIDRIFHEMQEKLHFLRHFNNNTTILAIQRAKERNDAKVLLSIYGIND